jgi:sec-independent protein translocase protein TatA
MTALYMLALDTSALFALGMTPMGMIILLVVVLLLFGNRLPSVARSLGKSVNEFKRGIGEAADEDDETEEPRRVKQDK